MSALSTYVAPSTSNLSALMASLNEAAANSMLVCASGPTLLVWNLMDTEIRSWIASNNISKTNGPLNGLRVLLALADGTVLYDSASLTNTYTDYTNKNINENHNSRVAILQALLGNSGVAFESRLSSSTNSSSNYMAQRIYFSPSIAIGTIRISLSASTARNT